MGRQSRLVRRPALSGGRGLIGTNNQNPRDKFTIKLV